MITWNLTPEQADFVLKVLQLRPYGEVASLLNELIKQSNEPRKAVENAVE